MNTLDSPEARAQIEESLEAFVAEGLEGTADDRLALKYLRLIELYWCDQPLVEKERVSTLYRQAFGIAEEINNDDILAKPQEDFRGVVGEDGWFGDLLTHLADAKPMPQLIFGAALALVAAGLGRRPRINWSAAPAGLYPNVYVLLIGDTGAGKGTAIDLVQPIVQGVLEPALAPNVLPDEGSQQGYAACLAQRCVERGGDYADGIIIAEELRVLLSDDKYKSQLITWLTSWYSKHGPWSRALRGGSEAEFNNPYVCCLFASNMAWLKLTPGDAILGGFWPRFLKFHTPENQIRWPKFAPTFNANLGVNLSRRLAKAFKYLPDEVSLSADAMAWSVNWHDNELQPLFMGEQHARIKDWYQRMNAHVLKMACIWQFVDGELRDTLDREWLEKSWKVMLWMRHTVHYMYGSIGVAQTSLVLVDVLERLAKNGGKMEGKRLVRSFRGKYRAPEVRTALRELQIAGDVKSYSDVATGIIWALIGIGRNGEVGK